MLLFSMSKKEDTTENNGVLYTVLSTIFRILRPYTPQIVPLFVCSLFIPIILTISGFAGFVVWNSVSATWQAPVYLQYGDGVAPYAHTVISSLHPNQRYDVSLRLAVPSSEANLALGNFMATLVLSTPNNQTLATVRRPAVAVVPTPWWPFKTSNIIHLEIPMLSSFVSGTSSLQAYVEVGRKDSWRSLGDGSTRELSVASASLHGLVIPHGIRGLAIRFPLLSSLAAAGLFLFITSTIFGLCILPMMLPGEPDEGEDEEQVKQEDLPTKLSTQPSSSEKREQKKRALRRLSEASEDSNSSSVVVKKEEVTDMPPADEKPAPESLRQRRVSTKKEPVEAE